ncbi:tetratricopeptide repeat protein 4-like [Daphnia pulex]|uniref:tetratricopeptide repeat protein 4-like n=1 Tax=Daphnia pulex TaxID=6669 RepID=UPI001EDE5461|nr:tetratricopeptide repeat protein 4-like [Daphnia pulex]XP_046447564.1 tetratricopeptide repeat protein 4-like [Daphnia pulex]XP_046447565.1 tetratricopeptide repeat protein 4-like [Daphnia pulex]XP_046447566.1 tetratricopeptide repeat protein 4-like [Daphnia pulex]XP_046447567.1 tetratricopeptide repeat protein 4-like [Daphnia pulex]XP_046447568.1 tetratricopeptide repeat protein 4-like [Daphnia pulex]XP_046447569.1 tetratricopeptide repeat protein 4-like [Daphnia pulex]XP_046447570.1 tet
MTDPKAHMTDEEKHQLALKLDEDLEEFINSRKNTPYSEGWNEETWEQEMEQHPFFMKKLPEEGEPLPPLLEAFQQLKYDPEENTTEDLALSYKDDGNFNFKLKKYRFAIANYTEGLKQKCGNVEIDATLYLNRAACQFHLGNYRSSLNDSLQAAKLKPDYTKAVVRAAQCCLKLKRYADGQKWCDYGIRLKNTDPSLVKLRTELVQGQKLEERNKRKEEIAERKEEALINELITALGVRGINTGLKRKKDSERAILDLSSIEPCHPAAIGKRVHLVDGCLVWPVLFLYPEYGETDFVQEFHEDTCFMDHLQLMFEELPLWDLEKKYNPASIRMYYEHRDSGKLHVVDPNSSLKTVLSQNTYVVQGGTPGFICLVEGSPFQKEFLKRYTS